MPDVPADWANALEEALRPGDPAGTAAQYVLTGEPADALREVLAGNAPAARYGRWFDDGAGQAMATVYAGFADVDAAVLRRLGRLLDAARAGGRWRTVLGDLEGCRWPELMLEQAAATVPPGPLPFTFADLARIAAEDGASEAGLVRAVLSGERRKRSWEPHITAPAFLNRLPGLAAAVAGHPEAAAELFASGDADARLGVAAFLAGLDDEVLAALAGPLAGAATSPSSRLRTAAARLLARAGEAAAGPLRTLAAEAKPGQRAHALELLAALPGQRDWTRQAAAADRAASVRALAARWDADSEAIAAEQAGDDPLPELPPLPSWSLPADEAETVAAEVTGVLRKVIGDYPRPGWPELPAGTQARLAALLAAREPVPAGTRLEGVPQPQATRNKIADLIRRRGYGPATALQVAAALGWFAEAYRLGWLLNDVIGEIHDRTGGPDLLTWERMLDATGTDGRAFIWSSYRSSWGSRLGRDWPDEQVWPFVAHNLDWLKKEAAADWDRFENEYAFLAALATLPRPPARLITHLYDLATGARKTDRLPAQEALARDPRRTARAAEALRDGKADTRLAAAQWLTRIADPAAVPDLRAAWKTEKKDVVRGALLDALTAAGEDAGAYLDPESTAAVAAKFTAKGLPAALAWLDWDTLPEVTWAASGEPVPADVVRWLCGTAVKAKSPEPDAMLRYYASLLDRPSRERLAAQLLTAWLAEDLRPLPRAEAEAQAAQEASTYHRYYPGKTLEQVTAERLPDVLNRPAGSATASKGLLAVAAACGGGDVVPPAERYLREWFGYRAPQGKALLAMLSWVDHPSAVQAVLAIGTRFRTRSLQDEAARLVGEVAERKGWTVDELADRTIPAVGFGDDGTMELSYGPRTFTAALRPDLTVELRDPDGKPVKALPAPRQSDDPDRARESKKTLSAAKKELKNVAKQQKQRLYEAMCAGRTWPAGDWERYLLRHPVAGPSVRRLVWAAETGDGATLTFRPLDDGTLTDADDNDVTLPAGARIRLAHDSLLSDDEIGRWTAHLGDYEITPLFQQLGRGLHALTPDQRAQRELADFTGHLLEAFALRGQAGKLGYTRGEPQDAGWFYSYDKRFAALGIEASIGFTGNTLPEENRTVALTALSFHRENAGHWSGMPLGDVPAVLLSECWQDLRLIAAEGAGFDPDWEEKTRY